MPTELAPGATPQSGSLEEAQQAFSSLMTPPKTRVRPGAEESPPEQRPSPDAEQVPPTPGEESSAEEAEESAGSEEAEEASSEGEAEGADDEAPASEAPGTVKIRVKLPDGEAEITAEEAAKGYIREADYTRKTMKLAEDRKKFEQEELPQLQAERQRLGTMLGQVEQVYQSLVGEPDWDAMKATMSPEQWQSAWIAHQQDREKLAQVRQAREQIMAQEMQVEQGKLQQRMQEERQKLQTAIPDFADPVKGATLGKALNDYALAQGFTSEEAQISDHRLVVLLHKAMQFDRVTAKAPTPNNRVERPIRSVAPGTGPARKAPNKRAQAEARLRQSGSLDDAAAALAEMID